MLLSFAPSHRLVQHRPPSSQVLCCVVFLFSERLPPLLSCYLERRTDLQSKGTCIPVGNITMGIQFNIGEAFLHDFKIFFLNQWHFPQQHPLHFVLQAAPILSHFHQFRNSLAATALLALVTGALVISLYVTAG